MTEHDYDWDLSADALARLQEWANQHNAEPKEQG